jgi:hypothetical protein
MKTIHFFEKRSLTIASRRKLIKTLYDKFLCEDSSFHFFYEPELIVRADNKVCEEIKKYMFQDIRFKCAIYGYPKSIGKQGNYCWECDPVVLKNLDLFREIYHAHSILALTLSKSQYIKYMKRLSHTAANTGGLSYYEEGQFLMIQAMDRFTLYNLLMRK